MATNEKGALVKIDVGEPEPKRLTDSKPGGIEQQ